MAQEKVTGTKWPRIYPSFDADNRALFGNEKTVKEEVDIALRSPPYLPVLSSLSLLSVLSVFGAPLTATSP